MTYEEAKNTLITEFAKFGFTVRADQTERRIFVKKGGYDFYITNIDIHAYALSINEFAEHKIDSNPTVIINTQYREQPIRSLNRVSLYPDHRLNRSFKIRSTNIECSVARASDNYMYASLLREDFLNYITRFPMNKMVHSNDNCPLRIIDYLYRPITISIKNQEPLDIKNFTQVSLSAIDLCLFSLGQSGRPFETIETWPNIRARSINSENFGLKKLTDGNPQVLPKISLNRDLLHYHQQAASTDLLSIKYLTYYQILEYYFYIVSQEQLFQSMRGTINDLGFNTTNEELGKLVKDIQSFQWQSDETEMLRRVIERYITIDELSDFLISYQDHLGEKIFSRKHILFNEELPGVEYKDKIPYLYVAKRVKIIRNALVHSSNRYNKNDVYRPYSKKGEEILRKDLPLIRFLAEKITIQTSHPLPL